MNDIQKTGLYQDLLDCGLTEKQMMFVVHYCSNGFNKKDAYYAAGFQGNTNAARAEITRLLNLDKIREAIKIFLESALNPIRDKLEYEIVHVLTKRAFYPVSMFIERTTEDGRIIWKKLDDIPKDYHCVIDGITEKRYGKDGDQSVIELQLASHDKALERLDKYIGMTKPLTQKMAIGLGGLDGNGNPTGVLLAPSSEPLTLDEWKKQEGGF